MSLKTPRAAAEITVKPEVTLLEDLLNDVRAGYLRVPRFQRPFVWRPNQMLELFDSIERGYPIGSILVWDTTENLSSLDTIGGLPLPASPAGGSSSFILDGHQRLSTLLGALMREANAPWGEDQSHWRWWIYRDLASSDGESNRFRHWRVAGPPPASYLPMRSVLRTVDFLAYARELQRNDVGGRIDELIDEAEQIAQRIKSYKVAVIRLVGGSLNQAVEVFSRLNSSGSSMTPDLMVSALTYEEGESLADRIDGIREELGAQGFPGVESIIVFRSILAVMGEEDILQARWEALARRVQNRLDPAVPQTEMALQLAVAFLREQGVPQARLLPYGVQLVLLAAFFAREKSPSASQLDELTRWFWATSWSGYFAGANTTQIKSSLQDMKAFAAGSRAGLGNSMHARAFPDRYDLRSARVRTLLIWFMRAFPRPLDLSGELIDPIRLLADLDTGAFRHVVPASDPLGSSPANRLMFPTPPGLSVRRALIELPDAIADRVAGSHCIPEASMRALKAGQDSDFVALRARTMADRERQFMGQIGVEAPPQLVGETDIDTE